MSLRICDWKYGKRWVYSITYDEALVDLHRFAVPYHEECGIPGHLEVVVGQMGEVRRVAGSSFNGYRHMNADELKDLMARGWGVGNHSWTHVFIKPEMVDQELRVAKEVLEQAIDAPGTAVLCPRQQPQYGPTHSRGLPPTRLFGRDEHQGGNKSTRGRVLLARPQSSDP